MRTRRGLTCLSILLAGLAAASCETKKQEKSAKPAAIQPRKATGGPTLADTSPRDYAGLHNVVAYHDGYFSGSVPEGDTGFDTLSSWGIRTIISVDGAEPDVAEARKRGIRYIHLPIGYDGFDDGRLLELVRATRDSMNEGPVYIHCHHGKHRSAGAAAAVGVSLGWADSATMIERMKVSGTAPGYTGLYACAANASVISLAVIDAASGDFPEVSHPTGFIKSMVEIDHAFEHLKLIEKAGWSVPLDHPDLVPAAEAGRLADTLRLLIDGEESESEPPGFHAMMKENSEQSGVLEEMLAAGERDAAKLSAQLGLIGASCKDCHVKYRDDPNR